MDMMKMMGKVKEMQDKIKEAQEKLQDIDVSGEAGAGLIKVEANAKKELKRITIDSSIIKVEDQEMLQDLIVAAVNNAIENAENASKEHLKNSTEGLMPNIPGFNFPGI